MALPVALTPNATAAPSRTAPVARIATTTAAAAPMAALVELVAREEMEASPAQVGTGVPPAQVAPVATPAQAPITTPMAMVAPEAMAAPPSRVALTATMAMAAPEATAAPPSGVAMTAPMAMAAAEAMAAAPSRVAREAPPAQVATAPKALVATVPIAALAHRVVTGPSAASMPAAASATTAASAASAGPAQDEVTVPQATATPMAAPAGTTPMAASAALAAATRMAAPAATTWTAGPPAHVATARPPAPLVMAAPPAQVSAPQMVATAALVATGPRAAVTLMAPPTARTPAAPLSPGASTPAAALTLTAPAALVRAAAMATSTQLPPVATAKWDTMALMTTARPATALTAPLDEQVAPSTAPAQTPRTTASSVAWKASVPAASPIMTDCGHDYRSGMDMQRFAVAEDVNLHGRGDDVDASVLTMTQHSQSRGTVPYDPVETEGTRSGGEQGRMYDRGSLLVELSADPADPTTDDGNFDVGSAATASNGTAVAPLLLGGVYSLNAATQAKIATLLRTLFVVQVTSDKSIMAFLGVAHYLMAFSHLVGATSAAERSDFFDALCIAFMNPVEMKAFMEIAFRTGPRGLHIGGRTSNARHVFGQPHGLREDVLRMNINPKNVKVQWLSRRLSLRVRVDVQRGAHATAGGLSVADRRIIVANVADEAVCCQLRERGCIVKYAKAPRTGPVERMPICLDFVWDASCTWFSGGMESALVTKLRDKLLRATPATYVDKDLSRDRALKAGGRAYPFKREDADTVAKRMGGSTKRTKVNLVSSPSDSDAQCSACGGPPGGKTPIVPLASAQMEHCSADVAPCHKLPHGGHLLAVTLPMSMDCGPAGRPFVDVALSKMSKGPSAPHRYSLRISRSKRAPEGMPAVDGAAYAVRDNVASVAAPTSFDILRSVCPFLSARPGSVSRTSLDLGLPNGQGALDNDIVLSVCSASQFMMGMERIDFTSSFELSSKAELIDRRPGRMIIFWQGVEPAAVEGTVTL